MVIIRIIIQVDRLKAIRLKGKKQGCRVFASAQAT